MKQSSLNVALANNGMFASDVMPNNRWVLNRSATNFQTKSKVVMGWALVANLVDFQQALRA